MLSEPQAKQTSACFNAYYADLVHEATRLPRINNGHRHRRLSVHLLLNRTFNRAFPGLFFLKTFGEDAVEFTAEPLLGYSV